MGAMDSDLESSCSSFTAPDSRRSWISDISFGSSSSVRSLGRGESTGASLAAGCKPHKANEAEWEAISRVRAATGRVGLDHFRLVRRLGSGDLGNVYLCQLRDPRSASCLYAMKVVDREALAVRKKLQRAETEKEILRSLDHPFLPTLYADFDASHYSCLVMEFCSGGDLHVARQRQPSRRFSLASSKFYAAETIVALEYLHMMGVIYRDLKPENVLVRDDGHIMLSDFDLSFKCHVVPKLLRQSFSSSTSFHISSPPPSSSSSSTTTSSCLPPTISCFSSKASRSQLVHEIQTEMVAEPITARSRSFVGTHEYLAPEVISGTGHGSAVDWWTLGVFLYEMIYGRTPFKGEDNETTLINIMKQPLCFPRAGAAAPRDLEELMRAQDLIAKLLVKSPKKRIGGQKGSAEIKRHDFFRGVNWALIRSVKPPEVPGDYQRSAAPVVRRKSWGVLQMLSKKERDEPFQIPKHFDYF